MRFGKPNVPKNDVINNDKLPKEVFCERERRYFESLQDYTDNEIGSIVFGSPVFPLFYH